MIGRLDSRTEFGSPQVLGAVKTDGRWLGVATTTRSNGRLAWVDARSTALRATPAKVSIRADLSRRRIELWRGEKVTERVSVAIGRPGSSTPTGRFTVTDKLDGRKLSPYYGCCVLALSGTQPNLPAGWSGGNRLAIHGTNDPGSIGQASSAGCLRAASSDLRKLMRRVPLGTPVEIRP
ncbi:L,D-transpeptidase [soil metagenome]